MKAGALILYIYSSDVAILGAGPAGIAAAITAAREGLDVLLIERYGCVGGGLTSMYVRPFLGSVENANIGREIEMEVKELSADMSSVEAAKCALTKLLHDAGVRVLLQSSLCAVHTENRRIDHIEIATQSGICEVRAKMWLDASGDGVLCSMAGCTVEVGRDEDGLVQPTSLMFTVEGIAPWQTLICQHEEDYRQLGDGREYLDLCHKACASGELPSTVNIVRLYATGHEGERMVNATQLNRVPSLIPENVFVSEYQLRVQMETIVRFLKKNIPGFENIRVNGSATTLGVRESRRVIGDYILTAEDLISGRKFDDGVVHNACFCIDIHNPAGPGQAVNEEGCPHRAQPYDIPYRCMTPLGFDNLLTAGRCISGTHEAHASYRVMRICMGMGFAAGHAAVLALQNNGITRDIDVKELRRRVHIDA